MIPFKLLFVYEIFDDDVQILVGTNVKLAAHRS